MQWLGAERIRRLVLRVVVLLLLADVAFIFLVPVLRLVSMSVMHVMDLYDPTVVWIPRRWSWENYVLAFRALEYPLSFKNTFLVAAGAAVLQTLSWIVPPHAIIIQLFILFKDLPGPAPTYNWLDNYLPFLVPSAVGMGLRGALFVFIFRQFFKGMPWELEDAARIDGAGPLRVFFNVMLPPAQPAIVVVFLFSFVWHWNDSLQPTIYLSVHPALLCREH
jgi:multiple sugar transport system permease protein